METKTLYLGGLACALSILSGAPPAAAAGRCFPMRLCSPGNPSAPNPVDAPFPEAAAAASASASATADLAGGRLPLIAPIDSLPGGQTYGRWAVEWQQWAVSIAADKNPLVDGPNATCAEHQVGRVWFLAGAFGKNGRNPATRICELPAGKALFFPMISTAYFAFLNDKPPESRTEAAVRDAGSCKLPVEISIWIDGVKVPRPTRFFTGPSGSQSPIFNAQLPPSNIFGVVEGEAGAVDLALTPSAEQGYYLFVYPLSAGAHTIHWISTGCAPDGTGQPIFQDITYHLKVAQR